MTESVRMSSGPPIDFTPIPDFVDHTTPVPVGGNRGSPVAFLFIGILSIIMSFVFMSMGAPNGFAAFPFLIGLVWIALFFVAREMAAREAVKKAEAAAAAEQRFKDEIADAVKERMKGTIKVRCRYCGSLNDEEADKCVSCGATM